MYLKNTNDETRIIRQLRHFLAPQLIDELQCFISTVNFGFYELSSDQDKKFIKCDFHKIRGRKTEESSQKVHETEINRKFSQSRLICSCNSYCDTKQCYYSPNLT